MTKVLVVAGGEWQVPIIKKAKQLGYYVICSNLYEDSPGFKYADVGEVCDVLNKEKNLEIAKKYNVDMVVTDQSDIAVPTVAYICENIGIKGIGMEIAERFTNKYLMRKIGKEQGFPTPDFCRCTTYEQAKNFTDNHEKSIIKPVNSQASRGVSVISCGEEFEERFDKAMSYAHDNKAVIAEEYIDGKEFTVDGLKIEDRYDVLAISEKHHYENNKNVAKELFFSMDNDKYDYKQLTKQNRELVNVMGLPFGMTHAEYKFKDGIFYLIEIAARGGGSRISSDIVPAISGVDSTEIMLRYLNGEKCNYSVTNKGECVLLKFFNFASGCVKSIKGVDNIRKWDNVIDIQLGFKEGDYIKEPMDDSQRVGYCLIKGKSKEEVYDIGEKAEQGIKIEYSGH